MPPRAQLKAERRHQDLLVYPIVYHYRHYLEVAIKGLIRQAQLLLGEPVDVPARYTLVEPGGGSPYGLRPIPRHPKVDKRNEQDNSVTTRKQFLEEMNRQKILTRIVEQRRAKP